MRYRMALPPDCDSRVLLPQLRQLEEEDPQLRFTARDGELHVSLMGRVQAEILRSLVAQRFGVEVELDRGRVLYKETIDAPVEGVGPCATMRRSTCCWSPCPRAAAWCWPPAVPRTTWTGAGSG